MEPVITWGELPEWAARPKGYGDGDGDGYDNGDGDGYGDGNGYGYGDGNGYGDGDILLENDIIISREEPSAALTFIAATRSTIRLGGV